MSPTTSTESSDQATERMLTTPARRTSLVLVLMAAALLVLRVPFALARRSFDPVSATYGALLGISVCLLLAVVALLIVAALLHSRHS